MSPENQAYVVGALISFIVCLLAFTLPPIFTTDLDTTLQTMVDNNVMFYIEEADNGMVSVSIFASDPDSSGISTHSVLYPNQVSEWIRLTASSLYEIPSKKSIW